MSKEDRTCRYCGHTFDTVAEREAHVPCPEDTGDRPRDPRSTCSCGQL